MLDGTDTPARCIWLEMPYRSWRGNRRVTAYSSTAKSTPFFQTSRSRCDLIRWFMPDPCGVHWDLASGIQHLIIDSFPGESSYRVLLCYVTPSGFYHKLELVR